VILRQQQSLLVIVQTIQLNVSDGNSSRRAKHNFQMRFYKWFYWFVCQISFYLNLNKATIQDNNTFVSLSRRTTIS